MGNDQKTLLQKTPIAIIGMSSLFPQSRNLREFWRNILNKVSCITDVPPDRWAIDDLYDPDPSVPDKTYCKRGGFIPDVDFNPMEFGLPPNILEVTDSSQLLSLLVARDLLKDCGYVDGNFDRKNTGVILGVGGGQKLITPLVSRLQGHIWKKVLKSSGVGDDDINVLIEKMKKAYIPWVENSFPGMLGNVIAGRVANRLDLGGTNCVVDAACAGSLAAIKMAVSDLLERKANLMISGGVDTDNSPFMYLNFSKTPAFTADEVPRPFDAKSKGIVIGEGVGMIMLKRLEDAERDKDRIYAVITGIGSSSDGRFKSIYAPRAAGQMVAINRAYQDAGVSHHTVGLVEAHGTGTKAGDAAEFEGLKAAFDHEGHPTECIALGTVKSQIGHTKTAAGAAGMIKTALALYHKVLPPSINVEHPNPKMHIRQSSFYINSETRPWLNPKAGPRRAGVSSFGFGGSNYHFVLEEYEQEPTGSYRLHDIARPFVLHAKSVGQLKEKCGEWLAALKADDTGLEYYNFVQEAEDPTIPQVNARIGFVGEDQAQVMTLLEGALGAFDRETGKAVWKDVSGLCFRQQGFGPEAKIVALFSGQGSQYLNMCNELMLNFPPMREAFAQMGQLSTEDAGTRLCNAVYPQPAFDDATKDEHEERLKLTQFIQPSVGCISVGLFRLLKGIGFKPDFAVGHSFGELTALWAAGVITDDNYFSLSRSRSTAMAAPPPGENYDTGAMLAVMGDVDSLEDNLAKFERVTIANYNSPKQVVIAGPKESIMAAQTELKEAGYSVVKLPVSAAFHSPLVSYAHEPFSDAIDEVTFTEPNTAVFSNVTAEQYPQDPKAIKASFKKNMLTSVRFSQEVKNISDQGGTIFVEFGPRNILTKLVDATLGDTPHLAIALNSSPKKDSDYLYRKALMQLKVAGVDISLKDIYQPDIVKPEAVKAGMNIRLNGSNYVSEATKQAFIDALNDGHRLSSLEPAAAPAPVAPVAAPAPAPVPRPEPVVQVEAPVAQPVPQPVAVAEGPSHQSEWLQAQAETLKTHGLYLQSQQEYAHGFFQLMDNIVDEYGPKNQTVPDSIVQGLSDFHTYQQDTLRIHEQYLSNQMAFTQSAHQFVQGQSQVIGVSAPTTPVSPPTAPLPVTPAPVVAAAAAPTVSAQPAATPAPVAAAPAVVTPAPAAGLDSAAIQKGMLEIVNEKTGYPVEMLDLSMDMEADLGIDSIKRVEILGAMTSKFPELPELDQNALAEMRTLGEIVDYVETQAPAGGATAAPAVASAQSSAPGLDSAAIQKGMLEIVNEKTGYPVEMLDLNMDMEADLGIDSIKRVEILGAMTSKFPDLPELDQNDLAEMRTLGEIVAYVEAKAPAPSAAAATPAPAASSGLDSAAIQKGMLEIVNEKTGYPTEMLDLNMDMEADLGIDSIKRVEILGAMTSKFPDLPELDQNDLAEMRTLGEIVAYVEARAPAPSAAAAPAASSGLDSAAIQKGMLEIVNEKTGYPTEMLDLNMDMEADLGIDSIKRVEILGAMTSKFPDLPELDQNDLAEMRTLGEIVAYVEAKAPASASAPAAAQPAASAGLDSAAIQKGMLEIVNEKTGYPTEMLDLNMDMEADLGIDSIKRVEILGAMTSKFPDLPELDQNALAEMRTLGEIVQHVEALVPASGAATASTPALSVTSSTVKKKHLTRPDQLSAELAIQGRTCVITDNGSETTHHLAKRLIDLGWQVKVLQFPSSLTAQASSLPSGATALPLANANEADLAAALTQGPVHGFIHLSPKPGAYASPSRFSPAEETRLKMAFFAAKHLHKSLTEQTGQGRPFFISVTYMDGEIGTAGSGRFENTQGGYNGLLKTLNLEWPSVFCRAIDLSPAYTDEESGEAIANELFDADITVSEIGCSAAGRMTLVAVPRADALPSEANNDITSASVFLVSGGAKGVTAACCIQLAQQFNCRFILMGRAVYGGGDGPDWAQGCTDEAELKRKIMTDFQTRGEKPTPKGVNQALRAIKSDREISQTLNDIAQAGGQAEYVSGDVTQSAGLKEKVAPAMAKLGHITGLVHGAGVLADKPIQKKTEADFDAVFATKIHGFEALLSVISVAELKYLVLFSSAAGFYGNNGQSDYAIANDILNKTAYQFRMVHPQCHVVSFNWGPWDGGMVTAALKRYFQERNVEIIPIAEGAAIFQGEMHPSRADTVQLLVGSSMRPETNVDAVMQTVNIQSVLSLEGNPFLQDHVIGGNPVLPSASALAWFADSGEKTHPGYCLTGCNNFQVLKGIVFDGQQAEHYQIDVAETAKSDTDGIQCQVTVSSLNSKQKPVWHYKADITLRKQALAAQVYAGMQLTENAAAKEGAALYSNGTLFHGPCFQGIRRVLNHSEQKLTLLCRLNSVSAQDQGQFLVATTNPYATDLMFQAMLVWVREQRNMGSLPLKFVTLAHYQAVPMDTDFYVSVDVEAVTETALKAAVTLHDASGTIYTRAEGAEVTISPSLNALFEK